MFFIELPFSISSTETSLNASENGEIWKPETVTESNIKLSETAKEDKQIFRKRYIFVLNDPASQFL